jgi:hypothetical protein
VYHPLTYPAPTGTETMRAEALAEVTGALDAANVTTTTLLVGPDDRIMVVVDTAMDYLAALVALELTELGNRPDGSAFARGFWRGLKLVIGFAGGTR